MRENVFEILSKEIRLKYKSSSELAKEIGVSRQWIVIFMNKLKRGEGMTLSTLERVCDHLGYEITIRKKAK